MDLSTIHHGINKRRPKKRVGRGPGSGHGKTATRGSKGQYASAGAKKPHWTFEGGQMPLFRRIPKRGFSHATWDKRFHVVNVGDLEVFADGATVNVQSLQEKGLAKGPADGVRILGNGNLTRKNLKIQAHHFSKQAAQKITENQGTMEVIPPPRKPVRNKMKPRPAKQG
jgi:large subunit ribosomal protein L15